ncbi:hypothetical protein F2Q70_00015357 [Brassica cretica]|uniref:Protease Do-like PDZ domain-containing protein n=1 Tax=Brassica cretica TaxID=69181 RepID=A0A8S9I1Y8_BRACR|nr:hypothetical protein F2Q70_00015357 [Brassica cretica]
MENAGIRCLFKMTPKMTRTLIRGVNLLSNCYGILKEKVVLLSVDGVSVGNDQAYMDLADVSESLSGKIPRKAGEQIVILSQVLEDDVNAGYRDLEDLQVKEVNGVKVDNMKHLRQLTEKCCLYTVCYTLTTATERFLSYPLVSLLRRVLQPLLQHDLKHFQELLSLSIRSASVSLSLYRRPHSYLIVILHVPETLVSKATFINLLLKFIPLSISPRYSLALQVYTTPAQHLDSTWSSPLNPTSASATTSATTSGQTSYIFNLPLLALCADQAQHSSGSATTFLTWKLSYQMCFSPPRDVHHTMLFSPMRYASSVPEYHHSPPA